MTLPYQLKPLGLVALWLCVSFPTADGWDFIRSQITPLFHGKAACGPRFLLSDSPGSGVNNQRENVAVGMLLASHLGAAYVVPVGRCPWTGDTCPYTHPEIFRWLDVEELKRNALKLGLCVLTLGDLPWSVKQRRVHIPNWVEQTHDCRSIRLEGKWVRRLNESFHHEKGRQIVIRVPTLLATIHMRWTLVCNQYPRCTDFLAATHAPPKPLMAAVDRMLTKINESEDWAVVHVWTPCGLTEQTSPRLAKILQYNGVLPNTTLYMAAKLSLTSELAPLEAAGFHVLDLKMLWNLAKVTLEGMNLTRGAAFTWNTDRGAMVTADKTTNVEINFVVALAAPMVYCHCFITSTWCAFVKTFREMLGKETRSLVPDPGDKCQFRANLSCPLRMRTVTNETWLQEYLPGVEHPCEGVIPEGG